MMEVNLDFLSEYDVITSIEMYHDFVHVMENKKQVLKKLIEEIKAVVLMVSTQENEIKEDFKELSCEIITEDNGVKSQQVIVTEFAKVIRLQLEMDDFNISVLDTFANWKCSLKNMHDQMEICNKEISKAASILRKVTVILQHTGEPDATIV